MPMLGFFQSDRIEDVYNFIRLNRAANNLAQSVFSSHVGNLFPNMSHENKQYLPVNSTTGQRLKEKYKLPSIAEEFFTPGDQLVEKFRNIGRGHYVDGIKQNTMLSTIWNDAEEKLNRARSRLK